MCIDIKSTGNFLSNPINKKSQHDIMATKQQSIIDFIIGILFGFKNTPVKPGSISPLISKKSDGTTWIIHHGQNQITGVKL